MVFPSSLLRKRPLPCVCIPTRELQVLLPKIRASEPLAGRRVFKHETSDAVSASELPAHPILIFPNEVSNHSFASSELSPEQVRCPLLELPQKLCVCVQCSSYGFSTICGGPLTNALSQLTVIHWLHCDEFPQSSVASQVRQCVIEPSELVVTLSLFTTVTSGLESHSSDTSGVPNVTGIFTSQPSTSTISWLSLLPVE